ncbi:MAG TPA: Plug domain-containing protein, partial [Sphingomicrobium sp.]|nr:Plug domain-containing protein [Sphingomicrobium sp.]
MRVRNAFILSTASVAALVIATPAFAQAAAPVDTTPEKTAEGEQNPPSSEPTTAEGQAASETPPTESGGAIIVTGSRIRRDNFTTPQNIDILTRDDQILAGTRSTAETLQSATVTSGTSQISGSFLGFLSDNGQGANTVGLRGLASSRTLVLLNGRRLAPAGVGPQLIAADLNT